MTSTFSVVLAQSTIYWPPSSCLTGLTVQTSSVNDADTTTVYVFPGINILASDYDPATSCLPAPYASAVRAGTPVNPVASLALLCPISYQPACTMVAAGAAAATDASFEAWSALNKTYTAIGCCPSNYQCVSQSPYQCISTPTAGETILATKTIDGGDQVSIAQMTANASFQVTATAVRFVYLLNSSVDDFPVSAYGQSKVKGVGVGGIVGIVVAVVLVAIGCYACYDWLRKRNRQMSGEKEKAKSDHEAAAAAIAKFNKPELDGGPSANAEGGDVPEGASPREVLPTVAEMPATEDMAEMPGGSKWKGKGIARGPDQESREGQLAASGSQEMDEPPMASGAL